MLDALSTGALKMVMCKAKDCREEFDVEFYHGQPDKIVECHYCSAPHRLSWQQPLPGVFVNFRCTLVDQAAQAEAPGE